MTWTADQLHRLDVECGAFCTEFERLNTQGAVALASAASRARETVAQADVLLDGAAAFIVSLESLAKSLASNAIPTSDAIEEMVAQLVTAAPRLTQLIEEGIRAKVEPLGAQAKALLQSLSVPSLEDCIAEAEDVLQEALSNVESESDSLVDGLLEDLEDLGSELFDGVEETVEQIEEIRDRVETLLATATEIGDAINEGTSDASDALQVAADIVNLTRDCIGQL